MTFEQLGGAMNRIGISLFAAALLASASGQAAAAQTLSVSRDYNIHAERLEDALIEFSQISGIQVIAASDVVAGKRIGSFHKTVSAEKALTAILAGTGLGYRMTGDATVTIVRLAGQNGSPGADPISAQGGARVDTGTVNLQEVVVTALKRKQELMKVPLSVTAFRGQSLEARGQRKLVDYIAEAPGVSVNPSSNGFASVEIRGISASVGDGTVGFYLDEVPFSLISSAISPNLASYDLDRVEVLRGPQGTLYGQGSMGGTIKLITNAPDLHAFGGKIDVSAGQKNDGRPDYSANAEVNIPIIDDKLALRMVGTYDQSGGFLDDSRTGRKDVNPADNWDYRAKLLFSPNDRLRITGSVWLERDRTDFSLGGFANRTLVSGPGVDYINVNTSAYNLLIQYRLPVADLTSSTSELDFSYLSSNNSTVLSPGASTNVTADSNVKDRIFSEEIRLVSNKKGPFQWSVGGLYSDVRATAASLVNVDTTIPGVVDVTTLSDTNAILTSRNWALFGETSYLLFNGFLEPTVGLRYFTDDRGGVSSTATTETLTFVNSPPPTTIVTPGTPESASGTFHSLNPRFNLAMHWSDNVLTYINVAKGFRSGAGNSSEEIAIAAEYHVNAGEVRPDTIWSYEVGSKISLLGGNLALELALYYSDWRNIQLLVTDPITQVSFEVNGGDARAEGVEYGVTYRLISGLTLQTSGNFNDSTLQTISKNLASLTFLHPGDPLNYVPKTQVNTSATYIWDLGLGNSLKGYLYGAVNYHSPLSETTTSGILRGDAITAVNLRAGVQTDRWGAYLFVNNATDENAAVTRNSDGSAVRLEPRVIGVNLRYGLN